MTKWQFTIVDNTIGGMVVAMLVNPSLDAKQVGHKAGNLACHEGVIAPDDVLIVHLDNVRLGYD